MDEYFSPPCVAKFNTAAENVFLRREIGEKKQLPASGSPSRPVGTRATIVPSLMMWLFIDPLKREEGRRARPRYDVPLRDAVPPTWVRRDAIT